MRKKISDFLKKTMIFEIATASLCAVVIIVLFYKGIDVDKGRFKIVYDVSINVMAASGLAFLIELISAKLNLAESIEDERKVLIRHHMFIKHLIAKYVASYIDLTTADYSYATDLLSKCDFKKCDGVKGMRQNFPPEELSRMFGHSILVADGMFMSPIAKWVRHEQSLSTAFEKVFFSSELKYFPKIRSVLLDFMKSIHDYDCNSQILDAFTIMAGKQKDTEWMTKCITNGDLSRYIERLLRGKKDHTYNAMMPYVCLYYKLKRQRELLIEYEDLIQGIIANDSH